MIEIEHEQSTLTSSSMWIDSTSITEVSTMIVSFALLLIVLLVSGVSSGGTTTVQEIERSFTNSSVKRFNFDVSPVTTFDQFLQIDLLLILENATLKLPRVSMDYKVDCHIGAKKSTKFKANSLSFIPPFSRSEQLRTGTVRLFHDRFLSYNMAELSLELHSPSVYTGVMVQISQGSYECATFEGYIRLVYAIFAIGALHLWLTRLSFFNFRDWSSEQRFTFVLLIIAVISNNPLYFWHLYRPHWFWAIIDFVMTAFFHAFVYTLVLVLLDVMIHRSARNLFSLLRFESLVGICNFVIELILNGSQLFWLQLGPHLYNDGIVPVMRKAQIWLNLGFVLWAIWRIFNIFHSLDVTERFHTYLYVIAASSVLGQALIVLVLGKALGWFEGTIVEFLSTFGVHNNFALMMVYLHWPYQPVMDMTYETSMAELRKAVPQEQANPILESLVSDGE